MFISNLKKLSIITHAPHHPHPPPPVNEHPSPSRSSDLPTDICGKSTSKDRLPRPHPHRPDRAATGKIRHQRSEVFLLELPPKVVEKRPQASVIFGEWIADQILNQ